MTVTDTHVVMRCTQCGLTRTYAYASSVHNRCPECNAFEGWRQGEAPTPFVPTAGNPYRLDDLQPLRDRLIVAPMPVPARSASGKIVLAETSHMREKPHHGLVLKVGPGGWNRDATLRLPMSVAPGDVVFYGKYSGQEMELGGRAVLSMAEIEVYNRLPAGCFVVVEHEDPKHNHLQGDYCDICATPEEKRAKEALEQERARLVAERAAAATVLDVPMPATLQPTGAIATPAPEIAAMTAAAADSDAAARSALEQERERLRQKRNEAKPS